MYSFYGKWWLGGEGQFSLPLTKPFRDWPDDEKIAVAATNGSPATVWVDPDGTIRMRVYTEIYDVFDCPP